MGVVVVEEGSRGWGSLFLREGKGFGVVVS